MTYTYDPILNMLSGIDSGIELIPISKEEMKKARFEDSDFLFFKDNENLYSFNGNKEGIKVEFENYEHLCPHCKNFFNCSKVMEKKTDDFNEQNYEDCCRIEKYPFITLGYEKMSFFYVWKCNKYIGPSRLVRKIKQQKKLQKAISEIESTPKPIEETCTTTIPAAEPKSLCFEIPKKNKHEDLLKLQKLIKDISP